MNYDAQQYAFTHRLATPPQLHLQQQHQFQQHHHIFHQQQHQQQYSQPVPASNVYHFQFGGAGGPVNRVLQHNDVHSMVLSADMQPPGVAGHGFAQQPFIKQALPVANEGSPVVISNLNGMVFSQQNNHVSNLPDLEGRLMSQSEGEVAGQQSLVGIDMMAPGFTEPGVDVLQQQLGSGMRVSGQHIFYDKSNRSGWPHLSQPSSVGSTQQTPGCQSTLPSFSHVWSQFSHQKQIDQLQQQHRHIQQYHSQQLLQHPFQQQHQQHIQAQRKQHIHTQQQHIQGHQHFTTDSARQTLPGIQVLRMQQQKPQQVPAPVQTPALPQQLKCFSVSQSSLFSKNTVCKEVLQTDKEMATNKALDRDVAMQLPVFHSESAAQSSTTYGENHPATAVTYTVSGPPKFTVTLDSLTHSETFPLNHFPHRSETESPSSNVKSKAVKVVCGSTSSVVLDNSQPPQDWQVLHQQAQLPKPFLHTSSLGSSFERCSSETSSFSSPPYTFTPPSSVDLMFSPDCSHLSKTASESSLSSSSSSGRTSTLSSSSSFTSSSSSSPPASTLLWHGIQSTLAIVPTVTTASSVASSACTTSTATVVFSCSTLALTTTSVTSTTPNPAERLYRTSLHSSLPPASARAGTQSLCPSPASRSLTATSHTAKQIQVPYSWHRTCENGMIVYVSPSGVVLQSLEQICGYLLSDNTCKCGLECPLQLEQSFSFDPHVESQPWTAASGSEPLANLCSHRREVLALAAFHNSQSRAADVAVEKAKKRQPNKSVSAEVLTVAPLKRLKTSITNAVNRHAISMGHFHNKQETLSRHSVPHMNPPVVGSCSNLYQGQLQPSIFDDHRSRPHMYSDEMLSPRVQQYTRDQAESKSDGHQQFYYDQQMHPVDHGHHSFMPAEDSLMFPLGPRKESVTSMSSPYSLGTGLQSNKVQVHPTASQLSHSHQQLHNLDMLYPQGPVYPHLPGVHQHQPPGCHSAVWKQDNQSPPAVMSHSPRPHPANVNIHHSHCDHRQLGASLKHTTADLSSLGHQSLVDLRKGKSTRPKSKKEKQKHINGIVDRSSPCSKVSKVDAVPSTSASFFGNPIVFVEQQTAIINNSIASCHMSCASPSPPQCDPVKAATFRPASDVGKATAYRPANDTVSLSTHRPANDKVPVSRPGIVDSEGGRSLAVRDLEKNPSVDKDEEDDQKTATDLDSNKSFSDTTENNDSAYLSQTGSDIDRSDTADGLDLCSETKCTPATSIRSPDSAKTNESRKNLDLTHTEEPSQKMISPGDFLQPQRKHTSKLQPQLYPISAGQLSSSSMESKNHAAEVIKKKRAADIQKDISSLDAVWQKNVSNCLNGDLSHLLASNNWNIPALQQVLAQYSSGQPGHLNNTLQPGLSQTLATGADFPASNLLSAAARAQLHDQQKVHIPSTLAHQLLNSPGLPQTHMDNLSAASLSGSLDDLTAANVSPAVGGTPATSQSLHVQPLYPLLAKSSSLVSNFIPLSSGTFAVNMLLPGKGRGQSSAADLVNTRSSNTDQEVKSVQGALMTPGILSAISQTSDSVGQVHLPIASVMSSSLGCKVAHCSPDGNTMLLNNLSPRMLVNASRPPVPVSLVTNVTQSLMPQVVPAISIQQTVFGSQPAGAHVLGAGTHIISTTPQAAQGRQVINPASTSTQLVGNPPQTAQVVNTLSLQGLSNQLVIAGHMQQVSPSLSQLSPALAAQILASQGHQQLQQMSPSFLPAQLPNSASHNMVSSVSVPTLAVTSSSLGSLPGSAVITNIHNTSTHNLLEMANKVSDARDGVTPLSSCSYTAASQPVFVIPQPSASSLVQVIAPAQTLNTATSLADVHVQQNALSQMFGQSVPMDRTQLQSVIAAGCSPLAVQQMVNAVGLSGVQQQQLQLVQLQQLMLQQLHSHGQNIQGIALPVNQTSSSQAPAIVAPALVSALVPQQQGIKLTSAPDMNTSLHSCLSPLGQSYQKQQVPSALAAQQVTSVSSGTAFGVLQNGGGHKLVQSSGKHLQISHSLQQQSVFPDLVPQTSQKPTLDVPAAVSHELPQSSAAVTRHFPTGCPQPAATSSPVVKPCQPAKSKPKPKSKKSENKKSVHPETEKNEEDVAATVQQILAQAVQQQKELSLAAKNQPPPPPKSKSKKSHSRSKASQAAKEHDLGRLASISDDVAVVPTEHLTLKELSHPTGVLESRHFTKSSHGDVHHSFNITHANHKVPAAGGLAATQGLLHVSTTGSSSGQAGSVEQTVGDTSPLGCSTKKSSISLKDHLSFIISKDKDGHSKRLAAAAVQSQAKTRGFTLQPTPLMIGSASQLPAGSDILFQSKI